MPRNHKRQPTARVYTKYPIDLLQNAYTEHKDGRPQRLICKKYKLTRSVFQRFIKNREGGSPKKAPGGQTVLSPDTENALVGHLLQLSEWGFPFDVMDLRMTVKALLDKMGLVIGKFSGYNNVPGEGWVHGFMKRHRDKIKTRLCQNISKKRASISPEVITAYFKELEQTLEGVPPTHIINYDETDLTDDPGRKRMIFKRGTKYPERIINSTKSSTSLMLAGTAAGKVLPLYVVYKAEHMWSTWREGGPPKTRYNRSNSGWFDNACFVDWFDTIALPYCRSLKGKKSTNRR